VIARPALLAALLLVAAPIVPAGADPCTASVDYTPATGDGEVAAGCTVEAGPLGVVAAGTAMQLPNPIVGFVTLVHDGAKLTTTNKLVGWECTAPTVTPKVVCNPVDGKNYTCYGVVVTAMALGPGAHTMGSATCDGTSHQEIWTELAHWGNPVARGLGSQWNVTKAVSLTCSAYDPNHDSTPPYSVTCGTDPVAQMPPPPVDPSAALPIRHT